MRSGEQKNVTCHRSIGWKYVLVTAAHNEAVHIRRTIEAVVAQTVLPQRWIIVSDRSKDGTDDTVAEYSRRYSFIELLRKTEGMGHNTENKVAAINMAVDALRSTSFDFIGNLDADVSFPTGYFEYLFERFDQDSDLGLAGGKIWVVRNGERIEQRGNIESVAGAVQLFRRECYDEIGGYTPLTNGFEDGLAEVTARFHGWKTRSFREQTVLHYRNVGTVVRSALQFKFQCGVNEYRVGFRFSYNIARALLQLRQPPLLIGTVGLIGGYLWACLRVESRIVPPAIRMYLRWEQWQRMKRSVERLLGSLRYYKDHAGR